MSKNIYRQTSDAQLETPEFRNALMLHRDRITEERLHTKRDIVIELAARDVEIAQLKSRIQKLSV